MKRFFGAALLIAALPAHAVDGTADYHARRVRFAEKIKGSVAVLFAAPSRDRCLSPTGSTRIFIS
jgi:hypothetical protein